MNRATPRSTASAEPSPPRGEPSEGPARSAALSGLVSRPLNVRRLTYRGVRIAYDLVTTCVLDVDDVTWGVLEALEMPDPAPRLERLSRKHGDAALTEAISELARLRSDGVLSSGEARDYAPPAETALRVLTLNISHDCNMRCVYCFGDGGSYSGERALMTKDVAERAVDFYIRNSGGHRRLLLTFFGGEPLLNMPVLMHTVDYANAQGALHGKRFHFNLVTNGLLLTDDVQDYIERNRMGIIISLDGPREVHDRQRRTAGGTGTYERVRANAVGLLRRRGPRAISMRGTFTRHVGSITEMVMSLRRLGFYDISVQPCVLPYDSEHAIRRKDLPRIKREYERLADAYLRSLSKGDVFKFFHFTYVMERIRSPTQSFTQCGASWNSVNVAPDGSVYPCHEFVNNPSYRLGSVFDGNLDLGIQDMFRGSNVKQKCTACWARHLCGGGCPAFAIKYGGDISGRYDIECELMQQRIVLGIWLYSRLSRERPEALEQLFADGPKGTAC